MHGISPFAGLFLTRRRSGGAAGPAPLLRHKKGGKGKGKERKEEGKEKERHIKKL